MGSNVIFSCLFLHQGGKWSITGTVALFTRSWARQAFSSVWRDSVWLKVNQIRPLAKQTRRHHLGTDKEAFIKRKLTMLTKTCSLYQRTRSQIGLFHVFLFFCPHPTCGKYSKAVNQLKQSIFVDGCKQRATYAGQQMPWPQLNNSVLIWYWDLL